MKLQQIGGLFNSPQPLTEQPSQIQMPAAPRDVPSNLPSTEMMTNGLEISTTLTCVWRSAGLPPGTLFYTRCDTENFLLYSPITAHNVSPIQFQIEFFFLLHFQSGLPAL